MAVRRLPVALAFGLPMLGSAALNNVFATYYLDFFLERGRVEEGSFMAAQLVFMFWNAFNDLAFGWASDVLGVSADGGRNRTQAIRIGGPLWCAAFLLTWVPWPAAWASWHFLVSMCFYDGMLTYVEVNHQALLADLSTDDGVRAELNKYSALAAAVGSLSAFFARVYWAEDGESLRPFQLTCLAIALVAAVSFEVAAAQLRPRELDALARRVREPSPSAAGGAGKAHAPSFRAFSRQLLQQRNLVLFVTFSAIQVFDCSFEKTFFARFLERHSEGALSASLQGTVVSLSFVLPHFVTVATTRLVQLRGLHAAVAQVLVLRLGVVAASALLGRPWWVSLLANRVLSECICRLSPLILSDLADEDVFLRRRDQNMSATIVGYTALFTKPSQSLAPMAGLALGDRWAAEAPLLVPGVCVLMQMSLWRTFSLKGARLREIKAYVSGKTQGGGSVV